MTTPDSPAVARVRASLPGMRRDVPVFAADVDGVLAELDEAKRDVERLRARTHEIQAQEMTKRAELDSQIAEMRGRWQAAKQWTEDEGLLAEWAHGRFASSPFWGMASANACDALARLVGERDEARAAAPEWRCPSCGATTRARMADRVLDERGFVDLDATYRTGSPASDRLVAECERRRTATGDPTTPQPEEAS